MADPLLAKMSDAGDDAAVTAGKGSNFSRQMMDLHQGLDELLIEHQIAVMHGNMSKARALFRTYAETLRAHASDEEDFILPVFAARGGEELDSPPKLFLGEHRKIRGFLDELDLRLADLSEGDERGALELLDREAWLKNLLMHHDRRERNVLYPKMDEWTSEAEQKAILGKLRVRKI